MRDTTKRRHGTDRGGTELDRRPPCCCTSRGLRILTLSSHNRQHTSATSMSAMGREGQIWSSLAPSSVRRPSVLKKNEERQRERHPTLTFGLRAWVWALQRANIQASVWGLSSTSERKCEAAQVSPGGAVVGKGDRLIRPYPLNAPPPLSCSILGTTPLTQGPVEDT